jgi:hypothetical protein
MRRIPRAAAALLLAVLALIMDPHAVVQLSSHQAVFGYHNYPEELDAATAAVRRADPVSDADRAVRRGEATLIAVCGYVCWTPGVGTRASTRLPIKVVPAFSGCIVTGESHEEYRAAVAAYAEVFNARVVALTEGGVHSGPPTAGLDRD